MVGTRGGARAGDAPPPPPVLDAQQIAAIVAVMQQVGQQIQARKAYERRMVD